MALVSSIVEGLRGGLTAAGDPLDERYWDRDLAVAMSSTGIAISSRQAFQVSCIFQGVRLIAETLGSLPIFVYREDDDGNKTRARDHVLWRKLRRQPNVFQTAQQWRETMTVFALAWGNGLSEIRPGPEGPVDQLIPLHPNWCTVEQLDNYRIRCVVNEPGKPQRTLVQEQLFRLQGLAINEIPVGENVIRLAREAIGLWLAQEKFSALFFGQGARPSVWMQVPGKLSNDAYNRLKEQSAARYAGLANMHRIGLAEQGSTIKEVGFSAKDSQLTESRDGQVQEIARWLNIPEHMLRTGKQPTFASVEQFGQEFIDITLRPWAVRWEQSADRDLVFEDDIVVEHNMDGLLRGNTIERAQAHQIYVSTGIKTRNEVRRLENLNALPGLDEPLTPLNMSSNGPATTPPQQQRGRATAAIPRRLELIAAGAARRVVRKEIAAVRDRGAKLAASAPAWVAFLGTFYGEHAQLVAETMELEPSIAAAYCERHRAQLEAKGLAATETWEAAAVAELTDLALETMEESAHA